MTDDLEDRVIDLETHLAHQGATVQDLSDMIARQWDVIDRMVKKVERLEDRIRILEADVETVMPEEPPPPHY